MGAGENHRQCASPTADQISLFVSDPPHRFTSSQLVSSLQSYIYLGLLLRHAQHVYRAFQPKRGEEPIAPFAAPFNEPWPADLRVSTNLYRSFRLFNMPWYFLFF